MTSSWHWTAFHITDHLYEESAGHNGPIIWSCDYFYVINLNKLLNKRSIYRWFAISCPIWDVMANIPKCVLYRFQVVHNLFLFSGGCQQRLSFIHRQRMMRNANTVIIFSTQFCTQRVNGCQACLGSLQSHINHSECRQGVVTFQMMAYIPYWGGHHAACHPLRCHPMRVLSILVPLSAEKPQISE